MMTDRYVVLLLCTAAFVLAEEAKPRMITLTHPPLNEAVYAGSTVVLRCRAHAGPPEVRVMWGEFVTNPLGQLISDNEFILNHPNAARYRIIHDTLEEFHLEITNVQMADGGRYLCQNTFAFPPDDYRGEAELIVLESEPVCNSSAPPTNNVVEGQTHTIECRVNYWGAHPPRMTWTGPPPFQVANPPPTATTVFSGVQYTVDRSMDLRAFEVTTNITDVPPQVDYVADNTPTLTHTYRAPQMFVFWGPKNLYHEPVKPTYVVGDVLNCTADSFPQASYFWQNMRTLDMSSSRFFNVTSDLLGTNQTMRCQAQNLIGGFVYTANYLTPLHVPIPTSPPPVTTPPTTTPPPDWADCKDLTGHWISDDPFAELIVTVIPDGQVGEVEGLIKNRTDTFWVECVGTTRKPDYAYLGLVAIWPADDGLTGLSAECHNCLGVEALIGNGMWRAYADSAVCGHGGSPAPYPPYVFRRRGTLASIIESQEFDVYKPTGITKRLGVTLKKK